jgi:PAS domain S-box-containing protein
MTGSVPPSDVSGPSRPAPRAPDGSPKRYQRAVWVGFLALSLAIAAVGLMIYRSAKESVTRAVTNNLEVIAGLKANQIDYWLDEKEADLTMAVRAEFERPELAGRIMEWLDGDMRDPALRGRLRDELRQIMSANRCLEITLRSGRDGRVLLSSDDEVDTAAGRALALAGIRDNGTEVDELKPGAGGALRVGFVTPVRIGSHPQREISIHVVADAGEILFPIIQNWPGWNLSAQTVLLHGTQGVVLGSSHPLPERILHMSAANAPDGSVYAEALRIKSGPLRGIGILDRPVFAYARPVREAPWLLVSAVDEKAAYARLNTIAALSAALIALLLATAAWWLHQQGRAARNEAERRQLSSRIDYLAKYANDCILLCDASGRILEANERCATTFGYLPAELPGMDLVELHAADRREEVPGRLRSVGKGDGLIYESRHRRKDGSTLDVEISAGRVEIDGSPCYQAIIRDISARKKLQAEREEHARRLDELTHRLVNVQEEERRHLSGELHDRIGANLATMNLNLRGIRKLLPAPPPQKLEDVLADTKSLLTDTIASIRDYCADLRPAMLDYSGLIPTLQELVGRFERRTGLVALFHRDEMRERLPPQAEAMLFRVAQEALTNCAKHGNARTVEIAVAQRDDTVVMTVTDDGIGFDPLQLGTGQVGLGLLTMRERAAMAGGELSIASAPGKGTRIRVAIPLPDAAGRGRAQVPAPRQGAVPPARQATPFGPPANPFPGITTGQT